MNFPINSSQDDAKKSTEPGVEQMNLGFLMQAFEIFVKNKWTEQELYTVVLENLTKLLLNLEDNQRSLILELIGKYKWMSMNEINASLILVLNSVEDRKLENCKRIYIFPIMKPEDQEKVKSGHSTIYSIRGIKPMVRKYDKIKFIELLRYDEIKSPNFKLDKNEMIFLVDDYLGSGETIRTTLEQILENRSIDTSNINIIAVAAQEETVNFLKNYNIPIYYNLLCKKGITGCYDDETVRQKIELMVDIEKLISISNAFSLGYNQSEALITLTRTPDNTFPIFWKDHRKAGKRYKAPFPRD